MHPDHAPDGVPSDERRAGAPELTQTVYSELRHIAAREMARERSGHTLQATALVHEAYLRLRGRSDLDPDDRRQFFRAAADAMRKILIDHARRRGAAKRGRAWRQCTLDVALLASRDENAPDFMAIEEAILRLEEVDSRAAEVVRLRFYAGLDVAEVASVLDCSARTIRRDWTYARAWLLDALQDG